MKNNILIRIDFQNDFVHPKGALTISNLELIGKHQQFANKLPSKYCDKIIDTYDTHFADTYSETLEAQNYPLHCLFDSWGWQQAAPFKPKLKAVKLYKSTTNIWNELNTYQILNEDWSKKTVYLCGVLSDICVKQAMDGFLERGANIVIFEDLCQGIEKQISDILKEKTYHTYIKQGALKSITSAQFFSDNLGA
ncbi:MAG: cysteine hydrolase family protein [Alphaproteobacteria bacterium]|nr:cysteine hydrolase family protein [Alphaproteobacteria bacterium]